MRFASKTVETLGLWRDNSGMQVTPGLTKTILLPDGAISSVAENRPKRRSDVNVRILEGETVVLDRQRGLIHQLNQTASYIWDRSDGKSTVLEIASQLVEAFDVDPETAAKAVASTVCELQRLNLLESDMEPAVLSES